MSTTGKPMTIKSSVLQRIANTPSRSSYRKYSEPNYEKRDLVRQRLSRDVQEWLSSGNTIKELPGPGWKSGGLIRENDVVEKARLPTNK